MADVTIVRCPMHRDAIREAGEKAKDLARQLADLVVLSDVPVTHWDEVVSRVAEMLAEHAEDDQWIGETHE